MKSQPTPIPLDRLGAPARRALTAAGYTTLEQLAEVPEREIAGLHGMGLCDDSDQLTAGGSARY